MSLPRLTGTAKLLTDPKRSVTRDHKPMATALLKFAGWRKTDGKWVEGESVVAAAIAFEDTARALAGHAKGDDVDVVGTCTLGMWQDKPQLRLTVTQCRAAERRASERAAA